MTTKTFDVSQGSVSSCIYAIFKGPNDDGFYILAPNVKYTYHLFDAHPELKWLEEFHYQLVDIPDDHDMTAWDNYYILCLADCAFPPMYLINAQHESDALECFETECEHLGLIEDSDLDDYKDEDGDYPYTINDNGNPVDFEAAQLFPVQLFLLRTDA